MINDEPIISSVIDDFTPITTQVLSINHFVQGKIPGFLSIEIEDEIQGMLKSKFKKALHFKDTLAGEIRHEYAILESADSIEMFMQNAARQFWLSAGRTDLALLEHRYLVSKNPTIFNLKNVWVNFQKKHEYNPIHNHSGDLSFVIWHKIPYSREDEDKNLSHGGTNGGGPGVFSFIFYDHINYHYRFNKNTITNNNNTGIMKYPIRLDTSYEGHFALFPSYLQHEVEPFFTSNDYRISIAGNLEIVYPE